MQPGIICAGIFDRKRTRALSGPAAAILNGTGHYQSWYLWRWNLHQDDAELQMLVFTTLRLPIGSARMKKAKLYSRL